MPEATRSVRWQASRPPRPRIATASFSATSSHTREVVGSVGYSGKPLDILVGLGLDGRITGARVLEQHEPIMAIGCRRRTSTAFVDQCSRAVDPRAVEVVRTRTRRVAGRRGRRRHGLLDRDRRRGRARPRAPSPARRRLLGRASVDLTSFEPQAWQALLGDGSLQRLGASRWPRSGRALAEQSARLYPTAPARRPTPPSASSTFALATPPASAAISWATAATPRHRRARGGRSAALRRRAGALLVQGHGLAPRAALRPASSSPRATGPCGCRRGAHRRARRAGGRGRAGAARAGPVHAAGATAAFVPRPALAPAAAGRPGRAPRREPAYARPSRRPTRIPPRYSSRRPSRHRAQRPLWQRHLARSAGSTSPSCSPRCSRSPRSSSRPDMAGGAGRGPPAGAARLSDLHPALARLVRGGAALGRQRADLHRRPAHRLPLGRVPARAPDLHPLVLRRGRRSCSGGRGAVLRLAVPVRRAAGAVSIKLARRLKRAAARRAVSAARAAAADQVPGLPRPVRALAGLDWCSPSACRGRAVQDRDRAPVRRAPGRSSSMRARCSWGSACSSSALSAAISARSAPRSPSRHACASSSG